MNTNMSNIPFKSLRKLGLMLLLCSGCIYTAFGQKNKVEIFSGVALQYNDDQPNQMYQARLDLTPGFKWHLPHNASLAGQISIPLYNDYGERYDNIRPSMLVFSKEMNFYNQAYVKWSAGLFSHERYGLDAQVLCPIFDWLAIEGQASATGIMTFYDGYNRETYINRISAVAGLSGYWDQEDIQIRVLAGRFVYEDMGARAEIWKHYKHCSIGAYAQNSEGDFGGGFKIVVRIPQVKRNLKRGVVLRPASNFNFDNRINADDNACQMVRVDPEYNEQDGHFTITKGGMR